MNCREKILGTLAFQNMHGEGSILETFYPWDRTVNRWVEQGLPESCQAKYLYPSYDGENRVKNYLNTGMAEPVADCERYLGFDEMRRMSFQIPFFQFCKEGDVTDYETWESLKEKVKNELENCCTEENLEKIYGPYRKEHEQGKFSVRLRASGFFWIPRELMGIENHLYAFYDEPELMHNINQFVLDIYLEYLAKIIEIVQPEVLLFPEDLSGKNGPMLSPECFDEFVGAYYKKLFPVLKEHGVKNIFVDTDGDFRILIPNFLEAGVDGFLPVDVNAGMDIVEVRKQFPNIKFIGGFNKLVLLESRKAIDCEFERILPVIRQGGYVVGLDHQAAPDTPLENYKYYIEKLKEYMKQAGADR